MIFQEPMTSLNPVLSIGRQLIEAIERAHHRCRAARRANAPSRLLDAVRIPEAETRLKQYPHELSGGMRQRVMIAMALALRPDVLIADEPTTALDVTVQAQVLELLRDLKNDFGTSIILITHDMGVVAEMADRVIVMQKGRMIESGAVGPLFAAPSQDYTRALLDAVPRLGAGMASGRRSAPVGAGNVVDVEGLTVGFDIRGGIFGRATHRVHAVENVSFTIRDRETFSLVGESGCGKSTIAKALAGLVPFTGDIRLGGTSIAGLDRHGLKRVRRDIQMIFQDPFASLDPRMRVGDLVGEPLIIHGIATPSERSERVAALFDRVGLSPDQMERYPHEFSGGQRQRICIARALALRPKLIIADESVSALDVSVQARVLELLQGTAGGVRHRLSLHLARHGGGGEHLRPRRGHVSRPDRRDGHARPGFFEPAACLHEAADRRRADPRPGKAPGPLSTHAGRSAEPGPSARPVPGAAGARGRSAAAISWRDS